MAEVLAKDEELFFDPVVLVLKQLNVIDTLLQLLVIFLLKSVDVEDEKMAIIASDPS